jgi:hypothetical protein
VIANGSTISYAGIVGPGQTLPLALTGTMFYLTVATAPLFVRPTGVSPWSQFQPGTGTETPTQFTQLEIYNSTANPITFQVVSGFAPFIDHRLVANLATSSVVALGNAWAKDTPFFGGNWNSYIPDLSGQSFLDPYGVEWLALQRQFFVVQVGEIYGAGELVTMGPAASPTALVTPGSPLLTLPGTTTDIQPPLYFTMAGNYVAFQNTGVTDDSPATGIWQQYLAVLPGFAGNPPS